MQTVARRLQLGMPLSDPAVNARDDAQSVNVLFDLVCRGDRTLKVLTLRRCEDQIDSKI